MDNINLESSGLNSGPNLTTATASDTTLLNNDGKSDWRKTIAQRYTGDTFSFAGST